MKSFQDIIQYLVCGVNPITNINEIADVGCVSPPTVYSWKNQGTEPKFSQVVALNNWLISEKNCDIIQKTFFSKSKTGYCKIQAIRIELAALEAEITADS